MYQHLKRWLAASLAVSLAACAVTPQQFSAQRTAMSDSDVCYAWVTASKSRDPAFESAVTAEIYRRGLSDARCTQISAEKKQAAMDVAGAAFGILGAAALIGLAAKGGGSGIASALDDDDDWDWGLFYNEHRQLMWACRGVQTGQFADQQRCAYKLKADTRWPSLQAPR